MTIFQQIALAIWRWLTPKVEGALDPEYKRRLDKVKLDTLKVEAAEKESERLNAISQQRYQASAAERAGWDKLTADLVEQNNESEGRFIAATERIAARQNEAEKRNQVVRDRSDDDAFGGGVPKSVS